MEKNPLVQPKPEPFSQDSPQDVLPVDAPIVPEKKSKKWLIIGFTVFLLTVTGAVGYFAYQNYQLKREPARVVKPTPSPIVNQPSPTPNSTSDWKTYTNSQLGFSIKYPQHWTPDTNQIDLPEECFTETSEEGRICESGYLRFAEYNKPQDQKLVDYLTTKYADKQPQIYIEENVEANILKLRGLVINFMGMWGPINAYIPINNSKYLEIEAFAVSFDTFNQILTTFKFIDQGDDTADWMKYVNKAYNFSIQYPKNWTVNDEGIQKISRFDGPECNIGLLELLNNDKNLEVYIYYRWPETCEYRGLRTGVGYNPINQEETLSISGVDVPYVYLGDSVQSDPEIREIFYNKSGFFKVKSIEILIGTDMQADDVNFAIDADTAESINSILKTLTISQ